MQKPAKKWWNNKLCNKRSITCPGDDYIPGRITFKRSSPSEETKQKISSSNKGNIPWNKGLTGIYSEETLLKMSLAKEDYTPWNKGVQTGISWNRGLTADTDERVRLIAEKQTGQKRVGNYANNGCWKGEGNPWFGKNRSKENSPRYKGDEYRRAYKDYRNIVSWLTEKNYDQFKDVINPLGLNRAPTGVEGGYHLDHIFPIAEGFKLNIDPEEIAKVENLQMLPWRENIIKSNKVD